MRKILYATTALTTAALIAGAAADAAAQTAAPAPAPAAVPADKPFVSKSAERIKLTLAGFYQQWAVFTDQSFRTRATPDTSPRHQPTRFADNKHNSEICVIGQTTLDNGLTVGVNVQIEAFTSAETIDESYLFLQSPTLGQFIIGDENNAGYLLHVTAPDGGISLDSGDLCNIRAFETSGPSVLDTPLCTTNFRLADNDSGKFTYITPRFAGFQAGVSYIPNFENGGDNNSALTRIGTGENSSNRGIGNGVAGGLNFTNTFGDFGVQASVGALWAESGSGFDNPGSTNLHAYNAGAQFSVAGFSFGGGWMYVPQGSGAPGTVAGGTANRFNGQSWTVGAAYEFGPYKVGLGYMYGDNNTTSGGGKARLEQGIVSGTYTLGPGIRLVGGVMYYDWQSENRLSENRDGIGGLTGLKLSF